MNLSDFLKSIDWWTLAALIGAGAAVVRVFFKPPIDTAKTRVEISAQYQDMLGTATDELREARAELQNVRVMYDEYRKKRDIEIEELTRRVRDLEATIDDLKITLEKYRNGSIILISQLQENDLDPRWTPEDMKE